MSRIYRAHVWLDADHLAPGMAPKANTGYSIYFFKLVGRTGFEPVTFSVSGRRAPAAPTARDDESLPGRARCCATGTGAPRTRFPHVRNPRLLSEHPRQPEPRHGAVVDEPRDSRDPLTLQRQHDHPVRAEHRSLRILQVAAEGRLPIGPRPPQPVAPGTAPARDVAQETGDRLGALELQRDGRT